MTDVPLLDLTGGKLDLLVRKGLSSTFRVSASFDGAGVTYASGTWTARVFTSAAPATTVTTLTVVSQGSGVLDITITAVQSALLTVGTIYQWLLIQTPTDTAYGPYPVMSGEINVEAA